MIQSPKSKIAGFLTIADSVLSRIPIAELSLRLRETDLVVSDVDECIFPFITQAEAAPLIFRRVWLGADWPERARVLGRAAKHGGRIAAVKAWQTAAKRPDNARLNRMFEKMMRSVPEADFREAGRQLASRVIPGASEALRRFRRRGVPVGFVSLGLDTLLTQQVEYLRARHELDVSFYDCNRLRFDAAGRFLDYDPRSLNLKSDDKPPLFLKRVEEYGAKRPLVIGHDEDDVRMLETARRLGGLAVGIRPTPDCRAHADIVLESRDWRKLDAFLEKVFRE